ncbi:MAG: glycoside hydrolase family 127 protein [Acidobacteriota bacterium]|nr:glycoside hydrolase family 127 protein [Acidobacteriota bacterium]
MIRTSSVVLITSVVLLAQSPGPREQGILDLARSPHAVMRDIPIHAVKMGEGFWTQRMRINVEKSIPTMLALLEQHGTVDNFRRLSKGKKVARAGPLYTDSDLYKWMEAVAFVLQSGDRPELRAQFDSLTDEILAAQEPSGYLNTYWVEDRAAQRFTQMTRGHELDCLGHLLQAGIAYYRATGNRKLLEGGIRFADYMVENFGPAKRPALTGHPEFEMSLVELYRTTGQKKYLEFAGYLLSGVERDRLQLKDAEGKYMFSGKPFTARTQFEGHAVRALYAASGAADYYLETGDSAYRKTLDTLWEDLVRHKMYVTGGVGSRAAGEAIGESYELPNAQAYGESCAAIANMMWNWRMLAGRADSRFVDVMERALYNGINSGMDLSGTLYCYRNPLESTGEKIRNEWYDTDCCPPNLERTFAALPGYLYTTDSRGIYANLYHSSTLDWHLPDGSGLQLRQTTGYPWTGDVEFTVTPAKAAEFSLFLRIPGWSAANSIAVNGQLVNSNPASGRYAEIRRRWNPGDRVTLKLDMAPQLIQSNALIRENVGRVAVQRGPLIYCLEQPDQLEVPSLFEASLMLGASHKFTSEFRKDVLGGIMELKHDGSASGNSLANSPLYARLESGRGRDTVKPVELTFIPYYAWANRGPQPMEVWIPFTGALP